MTRNEIFNTISDIYNNRYSHRGILKFENKEMLIDFTAEGEDFADGKFCRYSIQKDLINNDGKWCGTEELLWGTLNDTLQVINFIELLTINKEAELIIECF